MFSKAVSKGESMLSDKYLKINSLSFVLVNYNLNTGGNKNSIQNYNKYMI